jgi:curved DNA-binding protein CbpA
VPRDLYAALGRPRTAEEVARDGRGPDVPLRRDATQAEVDRAADAALFRHHPDRNPSDDGTRAPGSAGARFRDAKLAREVLGQPAARAIYDQGLWVDPDDPAPPDAGAPGWHRAVTDPARRQVLGGFVEAACVLGGLDQDAAALASDLAVGVAAGAVGAAQGPEPLAERATTALGAAAKKFTHPEGRAALREAGRSAREAFRKLFG